MPLSQAQQLARLNHQSLHHQISLAHQDRGALANRLQSHHPHQVQQMV